MHASNLLSGLRLPHCFASLLALALGTLGVVPVCSAITVTVTNASNNGPGSLRAAIAAIPPIFDGTILFDPSLSGATIYLASELVIDRTLTIDGSALASKITISGDSDGNGTGDVRVIRIIGYQPVGLVGVTIAKGFVSGVGGGIYNENSSLSLSQVTLTGNSAEAGGGIYMGGGALTMSKSTLSGNVATGPTGGGGMFISSGPVTVTNSTISGNVATSIFPTSGGGIYNGATLAVSSSTLSGNFSSRFGGGIVNNGTLTLTNTTIASNSASTSGGGIANGPGGTANVYNTSIVFNVADADADDIGAGGGVDGLGTFNMRNTLIAGNSVGGSPVYDDCAGTIRSYGRDLIGAPYSASSGSCQVVSVTGTWANLNDLNLLGILQDNGGPTRTVALLPGSNAIDGADPFFGCTDINGAGIFIDQRGVVRPKGVRCDVGAYEVAPDTDGDGRADELDNCKLLANPTQVDSDHDGYGNRCDADLNNNAFTNGADTTLFRLQLGQPSVAPNYNKADINANGFVNGSDTTLFRQLLGAPPGPSGLACAGTVPCP